MGSFRRLGAFAFVFAVSAGLPGIAEEARAEVLCPAIVSVTEFLDPTSASTPASRSFPVGTVAGSSDFSFTAFRKVYSPYKATSASFNASTGKTTLTCTPGNGATVNLRMRFATLPRLSPSGETYWHSLEGRNVNGVIQVWGKLGAGPTAGRLVSRATGRFIDFPATAPAILSSPAGWTLPSGAFSFSGLRVLLFDHDPNKPTSGTYGILALYTLNVTSLRVTGTITGEYLRVAPPLGAENAFYLKGTEPKPAPPPPPPPAPRPSPTPVVGASLSCPTQANVTINTDLRNFVVNSVGGNVTYYRGLFTVGNVASDTGTSFKRTRSTSISTSRRELACSFNGGGTRDVFMTLTMNLPAGSVCRLGSYTRVEDHNHSCVSGGRTTVYYCPKITMFSSPLGSNTAGWSGVSSGVWDRVNASVVADRMTCEYRPMTDAGFGPRLIRTYASGEEWEALSGGFRRVR